MTVEVKKQLKKLEKTNKLLYFRLYKFYQHPNKSLGGNAKDSLENYHEFGDISHFILNQEFFIFLDSCLRDIDFINKLDHILLKKIRYILFDSKEFIENYLPNFQNKSFRSFFQNKIPLKQKNYKNHSKFELYCLVDTHHNSDYIYNLNLNEQQLTQISLPLIMSLINTITLLEETYCEKYILPQLEKKQILTQIIHDNYSNLFECFLYERHGKDQQSFHYLICDNDFLKVVKTYLLNYELPPIIIDHIIEILEISIHFKKMIPEYLNFWERYHELGEEKIKKYHYKEAIELIYLLEEKKKRNEKIVPITKKRISKSS